MGHLSSQYGASNKLMYLGALDRRNHDTDGLYERRG